MNYEEQCYICQVRFTPGQVVVEIGDTYRVCQTHVKMVAAPSYTYQPQVYPTVSPGWYTTVGSTGGCGTTTYTLNGGIGNTTSGTP